jgi:hypothetical protein
MHVLRFNELARLIDPGKEPKTDKTSILADAIKYVQHINCENHQLKQLNKFLEVNVNYKSVILFPFLNQSSLSFRSGCPIMNGTAARHFTIKA